MRHRGAARALLAAVAALHSGIMCVAAAEESLYETLGVPRDAGAAALKKAFRKLALKYHPDKQSDEAAKEAAQKEFIRVSRAYEVLSDADQRRTYDLHGEEGLKAAQAGGGGGSSQRHHQGFGLYRDPMDVFASLFGNSGPRLQFFVDAFGNLHYGYTASSAGGAYAGGHGANAYGARQQPTAGNGAAEGSSRGSIGFAQSRLRGGARHGSRSGGNMFSSFSAISRLEEATLSTEVLSIAGRGNSTWLLFLHAAWCPHAEEMVPLVEQLAEELQGFIKVGSVDVGAGKSLREKLRVDASPTLRLYAADGPDDGEDFTAKPTLRSLATFALRRLPLSSRSLSRAEELAPLWQECEKAPCGCALLLTNRTDVPALFKALSTELSERFVFAHALDVQSTAHPLAAALKAPHLPWLTARRGLEKRVRAYEGPVEMRHVRRFMLDAAGCNSKK